MSFPGYYAHFRQGHVTQAFVTNPQKLIAFSYLKLVLNSQQGSAWWWTDIQIDFKRVV